MGATVQLRLRAIAVAACLAAAGLSFPAAAHAAFTVANTVVRSTAARSSRALPTAVLVTSVDPGPPIRAGFVGITTEYWDMFKEAGTNPSQPDIPFEQVLKNLAPDGGFDLRIGGDTSDWTWWPVPGMAHPPWARWTLTPAWMAVTQKLLEDLHAHLIVGINMEADNPVVAATEVQAIESGIGPTVPTTFELGNEPELYPKWPFYITKTKQTVFGRPANYSFPQITSEWDTLAAHLGHIRLAGVGYSSFRALPSRQAIPERQSRPVSAHDAHLRAHTAELPAGRSTAGELVVRCQFVAEPGK